MPNYRFLVAGHAAADWAASNPVLMARELGIETDTRKMKLGDGTTAWNSLPYVEAALDSDLAAIAALSTTSFGRALLTLADAAALRAAASLGSLATQNTVSNGDWSGADLDIANGGTGASSASAARSNLGLGTAATMAGPSGAIVGTTDTQTLSNKTFAAGLQVGGVIGGTLDVLDTSAIAIIQSSTGTNTVRFRMVNTGGLATQGLDSSSGFGFFGSGSTAYAWCFRYQGTAPILFGHTAPELAIIDGGNIGVNTRAEFGSGTGVIGIANAATVPASNPTGGGVLYVDNGALKFRGSSGTVTPIAPA